MKTCMSLKVIKERDARKPGRPGQGIIEGKIMNLSVNRVIKGKEYYVKVDKQKDITDVWDDVDNIYVPYKEFLDILERRNKINNVAIADKDNNDKKEIKEDKRLEKGEIDLEKDLKEKGWLKEDKVKEQGVTNLVPKKSVSPKIIIDKRMVAGKLRNVTLVYGNINDVYDDATNKYLPIEVFRKIYDDKGERLDINKNLDKKNVVVDANKVPLDMSDSTVTIPKLDIGIGIDKLKDKDKKPKDNKEDKPKETKTKESTDPYDWYISKISNIK